MDVRTVSRIESAADAAAATLFAAGVGYSLWALTRQATTTLAAMPAFALCLATLRRIEPVARGKDIPATEPAMTQVSSLLAEADRSIAHSADELVLDDILAALDPDSRVVRLFERDVPPTPGALKQRTDEHLEGIIVTGPAPDASQALHDALADLRRSLN